LAFYAYMLRCSDGTYYTGHTEDMEVRLAQHQRGTFPGYTHDRRPVALVWCQDFPERDEARAAEHRIKGWSRAKKEALIARDWTLMSLLARNRQGGDGPSTGSGQTGMGAVRQLYVHAQTPNAQPFSIAADAIREAQTLYVRFVLKGDLAAIVLPRRGAGERRDELWRTTCMEAFVRPRGDRCYVELNFAPSLDWASYRFSNHREGLKIARTEPKFDRVGGVFHARIDFSDEVGFAGADWQLNLTAVIEETDGTKSYWALAHPPGKPDFHHPACFMLELPAPDAP
jgi:predicted GIY-YIG superfamily endonuclease